MEKQTDRVLSNSLSIYAGRIINLVFNFFIYLYLANYLGAEVFGRFSTAIAYIGVFDILANFGLNQIAVREIAREREDQGGILGSAILLKVILTVSSILLLLAIMPLMGYSAETLMVIAIISFNFLISSKLSSTRTILESIFQAKLRMGFPILCNIVDNGVFAILLYIGISRFHVGLTGTAIIYTLCNLPGTLMLLRGFWLSSKPRLHFYWQTSRYLLRECLPLAAYIFFSVLTTRIDVLILSWIRGEEVVGLYAAATRLVYPLTFLSTSLTISLFPLLARHHADDRAAFSRLARLGAKYVYLIGVIVVVPCAFAASSIIHTLYVAEYAPAAPAFQLLILSLGLGFLNFYFVDLLITAHQQKWATVALAVSLLLNVGLNLWLIPSMGIVGAAHAKLWSSVASVVLLYAVLHRVLKLESLLEFRLLPATLVFIGSQWLLLRLGLIWRLSLSVFIFIFIFILFKVFHYEERNYFLTLFRLNRTRSS